MHGSLYVSFNIYFNLIFYLKLKILIFLNYFNILILKFKKIITIALPRPLKVKIELLITELKEASVSLLWALGFCLLVLSCQSVHFYVKN
jgi:hypothetical protein